MELYERLIELRKKAGLSQEDLAEKLNISRQAVSKWEIGQSNPDIENIIMLGAIYNVTTDYILLGKSQEIKLEPVSENKSDTSKLRYKFHVNGFLWLGFGVAAIIILYYVTNRL